MAKTQKNGKTDGEAGAPTKRTEAMVRLFEKMFRQGEFVETACGLAKISRSTYYEWYGNDDEFRTRVDYALFSWVSRNQKELIKKDPNGRWKVMKNRCPQMYRDRIEQEITGQDRGPIKLVVTDLRIPAKGGGDGLEESTTEGEE